MTKAIFFDIDGTLVSFETQAIPASARKALSLLREKGIKIFIATGRSKELMLKAVGDLEFDGYVTMNGAYCFTSGHQEIFKGAIPEEDIERLITRTEYHHIPFVFVEEDTWYVNCYNEELEKVRRMIPVFCPDIAPIETAKGRSILQITGFFTENEEKDILDNVLPHCEAMRWYPTFTDIIAKGNSKSRGIDHVTAYFGIDLKDTMAFGDGGNDIPMLEHAGIGVAMGNASEKVQAHADYVTTSVDEDGIWNALVHFGIL